MAQEYLDDNPGATAVQAFKSVPTCQQNAFGNIETNTAYIMYALPQVGKTVECFGHLLRSWQCNKTAPVLTTQNFSDEFDRFELAAFSFNDKFIAPIWKFAGVATPPPRIRMFREVSGARNIARAYKDLLAHAK